MTRDPAHAPEQLRAAAALLDDTVARLHQLRGDLQAAIDGAAGDLTAAAARIRVSAQTAIDATRIAAVRLSDSAIALRQIAVETALAYPQEDADAARGDRVG